MKTLRFYLLTYVVLIIGCTEENEDPYLMNSPSDQNIGLSETISFISSVKSPDGSLNIGRTTTNGLTSETTLLTDSAYNDYKPVISPDGSKIAFFRAYSEGIDFFLWNTSICIMDIDGSNFRELTDYTYMNTEPYWSRDGSNSIVWNRMIHSSEGDYGTYVYETLYDATPGDEKQLTTDQWSWSNSCIKDGRVFVQRKRAFYLMEPNPLGSEYIKIDYPDSYHQLHKLTISNDEKMIAYMKRLDPDGDLYYGSEMVYAAFDASIPAISNEVVFVPKDETRHSWYVSISENNEYIIYAEDGKIMLHDVAKKINGQVTTKPKLEYRYPTFIGTSK